MFRRVSFATRARRQRRSRGNHKLSLDLASTRDTGMALLFFSVFLFLLCGCAAARSLRGATHAGIMCSLILIFSKARPPQKISTRSLIHDDEAEMRRQPQPRFEQRRPLPAGEGIERGFTEGARRGIGHRASTPHPDPPRARIAPSKPPLRPHFALEIEHASVGPYPPSSPAASAGRLGSGPPSSQADTTTATTAAAAGAATTRADSPRHSAAFPSGSANDAADAALAALQFSRQLFDDLIQRRLEGLARGL